MMQNVSHIDMKNKEQTTQKQRHTELMEIFELLKEKWPKCFDNVGMYLPDAELAVCKLLIIE